MTALLLLVPWLVAVLTLGTFVVLQVDGWPGEFVAAGGMFCEAFRGDWGQPANTWSNLGFVAAGLWIAARCRPDAAVLPFAGANLFTSSAAIPVVYASAVVFLGPGSMFMHGSGRAWGGTVDVVSMLVFIVFPAAYAAVRCLRGGPRAFLLTYGALLLVFALPRALDVLPVSGTAVYVALVPTIGILEAVAAKRRPEVTRQWRWLGLTAASFTLALVIWRLSHSGAPLCDPHSLVQGHAVWHLLCAVSTLGFFAFYVTEDDPALRD